jgi:hypothetical protein
MDTGAVKIPHLGECGGFIMQRECSKCHRPFAAKDLAKDKSKEMEAERKTQGMHGVRFLYYTCSECGQADIFVDILQLDNESAEEFRIRKETIEAELKGLHGSQAELVLKTRETAH